MDRSNLVRSTSKRTSRGALEAWKAGVIAAGKINKPELGENQLNPRPRDHFAKIGDKAGLRDPGATALAAAQKAVARLK